MKSKKIISVISAVLAVLMIASALSGCSGASPELKESKEKAAKVISEYNSGLNAVTLDCANEAFAKGDKVAKAANAALERRGIRGGLSVSADTRAISGGVIVRQGNIEVNCAVETLVQLRRSELASQVAEILFA